MCQISIITVVRNDCKGLRNTADSVVRQTAFERLEWIVIDGASVDGTVDVIRSYSSRIAYWVSEPDEGIYDAMNKGLAQATGEYCLFLNAGDALYADDVIARVCADEAFGSVDYLTGGTHLCRDGQVVGIDYPPSEPTGKYLFQRSLSHQATFIRTSRLKALGGYDSSYKIVADAKAFFVDIVMKNASCSILPFVVANYDVGGLSSINFQLNIDERKRFLSETLPPRVHADYHRMVYGETLLEKLVLKITNRGGICSLPVSLY